MRQGGEEGTEVKVKLSLTKEKKGEQIRFAYRCLFGQEGADRLRGVKECLVLPIHFNLRDERDDFFVAPQTPKVVLQLPLDHISNPSLRLRPT